jgi:5-methylcytosine-specific restriction protein A
MAFTEVEQVSQFVNEIIPDDGLRHKCLCLFADSIAKLNALKPALWGVHCEVNKKDPMVRLYAGNLIVLTLEKRCAWLPLDQISLEESPEVGKNIEALKAWEWDKDDPNYKVKPVPSKNGFYTPSESHEDDWPPLKDLHFKFLDRVANTYSKLNIASRKLDEPAVILYLKSVLDRNIPYLYVRPEDVDLSEDVDPSEDSHTEELASKNRYEGSLTQIKVNKYERNQKARKECLEHHGARCVVCDFAFAEKYGPVAVGFMVVHHLTPLSDIGERYEVDPIKDLRPVCPNCHAVIHKKKPPFTIEEMRQMISNN